MTINNIMKIARYAIIYIVGDYMEEQLRQLIEQAKATNNAVLVRQLNQALNTLLEQQRQQEDIKLKSQENINQEKNETTIEKKEVVMEQKQDEEKEKEETKNEEKPIKKQIEGEVSTLTIYQDGKVNIETKYLDIPINSENTTLITEMRKIAIDLGFDDTINDKLAEDQLLSALDKLGDDDEAVEQIEEFIGEAAKIGKKGKELEEKYYANTLERRELPYDKDYQDLLKEINMVETEDKESNTRKYSDGSYEDIIMSYQRVIAKIEALIDEAHNKLSAEKISTLETKLMFLKERVKTIQQNMEVLKETNYMFE